MAITYFLSLLCFICLSVRGEIISTKSAVRYIDQKYLPTNAEYVNVTARSRLSCVQQCRPTDNCVGAFFDETGWCLLMRGFLNFPEGTIFDKKTVGFVAFVEMVEDSWAVGEVASVSCSTDDQCWELFYNDSECRNGTCECYPCYKRTPQGCVLANCSQYGNGFLEYQGCEFGDYGDDFAVVNLEDCVSYCLGSTHFNCLSFDIRIEPLHVRRLSRCKIRRHNLCNTPLYLPVKNFFRHFKERCGGTMHTYYQRECVIFQ